MFDIIFDQSPDEVYTCGSKVSGNLVVKEWKYPERAGINIRLKGHVKVLWREFVENPDGSKTKLKLTHHKEFDFLTLESPWHVWYKQLKPDQKFPFEFILPVDEPLPSSHDGYIVVISYYIEADISVTLPTAVGRLAPISAKAPLLVSETVDINSPALLAPTVRQQEEHIHRWYSKKSSGTVTVTVEMPHTGYHLKESIPFTATVKNETGSQIKMEALLLQTVSYLQAEDTYEDKTFVIVNYPETQMPANITSVWSPTGDRNKEFKLRAYQTELVSSTSSKYVKVQHQLEVTASLPNNKTLKFEIPITIGNVPRAESSASASELPPYQPPFQNEQPGVSALSPFQDEKPGASALPSESPSYQPPFQDEKPGASPEVGWSRDLSSVDDTTVTSTKKRSADSKLTSEAPPSYEIASGHS